MSSRWIFVMGWILALPVVACDSDDAAQTQDVATDTAGDTVVGDTAVGDTADSDVGSDSVDVETLSPQAQVVILHTANERGWVGGVENEDGDLVGGVALIKGAWDANEPANHLAVSSGDCMVGAAISTWFDGAPAVTAMNMMGYDAVALGHHELDLGRAALAAMLDDAAFSVLAANVTRSGSGPAVHDAGWEMFTVDGVEVAVIGLANPETPMLAAGPHYDGLAFDPVLPALEAAVIEARAAGAQVIIALAHLSWEPLATLAQQVDGKVDVLLGGHAHNNRTTRYGGVLVAEGGNYWVGYTRVALTVERASGAVASSEAAWTPIDARVWPRIVPDPALKAAVTGWQADLDAALGETIGALDKTLTKGGWTQANWVTDSWRWAFPAAAIAIQNGGGLRADLTAGDITRSDVVDVLSYGNTIYQVTLTGAEIAAQLTAGVEHCGMTCIVAVSGLRYERGPSGLTVVLEGGAPLVPTDTYTVLVNDFMYFGGAGFDIDALGHDPYDTGLNYRDPVMDWTEAQATTASSPLDPLLDPVPRSSLD